MEQDIKKTQSYAVGDIVKAEVRSGHYVAEVMELNGPRALVKILAVLKHPEQGDLHSPYNPDVPMFHERRALSYTEKTTVLLRALSVYGSSTVPDYKQSLLAATETAAESLDQLKRWAEKSLILIKELEMDYNK
ncbi:sporulation phosphorelay system protein KapB [Paenibacillus radicis (ex Gao et al. 2016)]|uniref:Kinase-associated protein B n=1 Tax=Paenibacillus radicis (ex Gao et al. 2016) TaxID=1737354 RepID=A0A917H065_9BACL|nr:sporulation phosphorelay system protein KapB [Paenibacillus radicis (ex Gao et al. 2016)]GGG63187.1 kinase-associated protein B [Paenibacillus radicis (ex Gao et al. 2016)]